MNGSNSIQKLWWLHPAWLFALIVGSTMAMAISQSAHSYLLYNTLKHLNSYHGILAAVSIVVFAIGCQFALVTGRTPTPLDRRLNRWLAIWVYGACGLAIFGYLVWLAVAIKNGFSLGMLAEILLGDDADLTYSLATEVFENVSGVTTCTQFAVFAVPLGFWLYTQGERLVIWPVLAVLLAGLIRAFMLSERIAFIEMAVPSCIVLIRHYVIGKSFPNFVSLGFRLAPFLGVIALLFFFGCAEYFRSWKHYQKDFDSVAEFTVWRLSGYYTTSHNNSAMMLDSGPKHPLPYYTFQSLWSFPGVSKLPIGYKQLTGMDAYDQKIYMLERFATPELNNEGGIFAPAVDFGILGMFIFWFGCGFVSGRLYRSYMVGSIEGITLYPIFFLAILEVPRFLYLPNQRAFPAIVAFLAVIWFSYRRSRMAADSRLAYE